MLNRPVIGIDVAKEFCVYAALSPNGSPYEKPFKEYNTKQGLLSAVDKIKKVGHTFQSDPLIALESTGHYSQRIV
ncbi:IS110 family transposase, partial [Acetonema longum]|uniref:IS110 family transposase n=1 Tax=Acetonema longum TaxID=2374 RepID=UPI00058D8253